MRGRAAYLDLVELRRVRIDQVLVPASDHNLRTAPEIKRCGRCTATVGAGHARANAAHSHLAGDRDLGVLLVAERAVLLVLVVEDKRHARLLHTRLALLVHKLLQVRGADLCARAPRSRQEPELSPGQTRGGRECLREQQAAARTWVRLEMPSTKQIESKIFDLPEPLSPVIALNSRSKPLTTVRTAYDLNPSSTISFKCMASATPRDRRAPSPSRVGAALQQQQQQQQQRGLSDTVRRFGLTNQFSTSLFDSPLDYSVLAGACCIKEG